jgi:hypothetical protein
MWPIRFAEGSQTGKRKKDNVGRENVRKGLGVSRALK